MSIAQPAGASKGTSSQPVRRQTLIVMGVSGVGKTTVGEAVAERLEAAFFEGDAYHPARNVERMAAGQPLTDADRQPWIVALAAAVNASEAPYAVVACSALSAQVRGWLSQHLLGTLYWVHLTGSPDLIRQRLQQRQGHYMKAGLLESQFAALNPPANAFVLDVATSLPLLVERVVDAFKTGNLPPAT